MMRLGASFRRIRKLAGLFSIAEQEKSTALGLLYPTAVHPDSKWNSSIKAIVKKSDTIEGLASLMGVDEAGLVDTVKKVAQYAETGVDEDFRLRQHII